MRLCAINKSSTIKYIHLAHSLRVVRTAAWKDSTVGVGCHAGTLIYATCPDTVSIS